MSVKPLFVGAGLRPFPTRYALPLYGAILCLMFCFITPVSAQPALLIVEANLRGEASTGPLNPLLCDNSACQRITDLLFPDLLNVDLESGTFAPATSERGLALSWAIDGDTITYTLRDDRIWNDGTLITAYHVFYSYLAAASEDFYSPYSAQLINRVRAAAPLDVNTIAFVMYDPGCDAADLTNIPVIPVHVYQPDFAELYQFNGGDIIAWFDALPEHDFRYLANHPTAYEPTVTAGVFEFVERRYNEYIRLITPDAAQAFNYINIPDGTNRTDMFLRGETNLLVNPAFERREDIRAATNVRTLLLPGKDWLYISFNLTDPSESQSAYDEDGQLLEQKPKEVLSDPELRRIIQMAINVPALIEATVDGDGVIIPANQPPASWVYNNDLAPIAYDPVTAARLLDEAGWKDINRDGVRECIGCQSAKEERILEFEILYPDDPAFPYATLTNLIQQQLWMVGISAYSNNVVASTGIPNYAAYQTYDSYLGMWRENYPVNPDQRTLFTRAGDIVGLGDNFGSYHNPEVERLLNEARQIESCDADTRRDLYQQAQAILQEDQPYVWLFTPSRMVAWRGGIDQFLPFWEVVVTP